MVLPMSSLLPVLVGLAAGIALIALFSLMMPSFNQFFLGDVKCNQVFDIENISGKAWLTVENRDVPNSAAFPHIPATVITKHPLLLDAMKRADICHQKGLEAQVRVPANSFMPPIRFGYSTLISNEQAEALIGDPQLHLEKSGFRFGDKPAYSIIFDVEGRGIYEIGITIL
jgi:hypothetical protein